MARPTGRRPVIAASRHRQHPTPSEAVPPGAAFERAVARYRVELIEPLAGGGSGAVCMLGRGADGRLLVIKAARHQEGLVDGHDLAAFRTKQRQQDLLGTVAPAVARRYVPILRAFHDATGSAYVLPYLPYPTMVELARTDPAGFATAFPGVVEDLIAEGYAVGARPAPASFWRAMYTDRLRRRRWMLARHLPRDLLSAQRVTVNGRTVLGLDRAYRAACHVAVDRLFRACRLSVPVHGDLNLRNILVAPAGGQYGPRDGGVRDFRLLDPRGTLSPWDVTYDLAKMLFTLTLFDDVVTGGLAVSATGGGSYTVVRPATSRLATALDAFLDLLPRFHAALDRVGLAGGPWLPRLLFAHATHVLAEAACRLSDRTLPAAARRQPALSLLLLGLALMTDLHERLRRGSQVDVRAHLAALAPAPTGEE